MSDFTISDATLIDGVAFRDLAVGHVFTFNDTDGNPAVLSKTEDEGGIPTVTILDEGALYRASYAGGKYLQDAEGELLIRISNNKVLGDNLIAKVAGEEYEHVQVNGVKYKIPKNSSLGKDEDGIWDGTVGILPSSLLGFTAPKGTDGQVSPEDQAAYESKLSNYNYDSNLGWIFMPAKADLMTIVNSPVVTYDQGIEIYANAGIHNLNAFGDHTVTNLQTGEAMEQGEMILEPFGYTDSNGFIRLVGSDNQYDFSDTDKITLGESGTILYDGNKPNDASKVIDWNAEGGDQNNWELNVGKKGHTDYRYKGLADKSWYYDSTKGWYYEAPGEEGNWRWFAANTEATGGEWMWTDGSSDNNGNPVYYNNGTSSWMAHKDGGWYDYRGVRPGGEVVYGDQPIVLGQEQSIDYEPYIGDGEWQNLSNKPDTVDDTVDDTQVEPYTGKKYFDRYNGDWAVFDEEGNVLDDGLDSEERPKDAIRGLPYDLRPKIELNNVPGGYSYKKDGSNFDLFDPDGNLIGDDLDDMRDVRAESSEHYRSGIDSDGDGINDYDDPLPNQPAKEYTDYPEGFTPPKHGDEIGGATDYYNPYTGDVVTMEEGGWGAPEGYYEGLASEDILDTINGYKYFEQPDGSYTLLTPEGKFVDDNLDLEDIQSESVSHLQTTRSPDFELNEDWETVNEQGQNGYRVIDLSLGTPTGEILFGEEAKSAAKKQAMDLARMAATGPGANAGLGEVAVYKTIDSIVGAKNNPFRWINKFLGAEDHIDAAEAYSAAHTEAVNETTRKKNLADFVETGVVAGKPQLNIGGTVDEMAAPFLQKLYATDEYGNYILATQDDVDSGLAPQVGFPIINPNYNPHYSDFIYNKGSDGVAGYDPGPDGKYNTPDDTWNPEAARDDFAQMYSPNWLLPFDFKNQEASWRKSYADANQRLMDYYSERDENGQTAYDRARGERKKALTDSGFFNFTAGDDGIWGTEDDGQELDAEGNPVKGIYGQLADDLTLWQYGAEDEEGSRAYQDKQLMDASDYYRGVGDQLEQINFKQKAQDRANLYNFMADTSPIADARMEAVNNVGSAKLFGRKGVGQDNYNRMADGSVIKPKAVESETPADGVINVTAGGNTFDLMGGMGNLDTSDIGSFINTMGGTAPTKPENNMFLSQSGSGTNTDTTDTTTIDTTTTNQRQIPGPNKSGGYNVKKNAYGWYTTGPNGIIINELDTQKDALSYVPEAYRPFIQL